MSDEPGADGAQGVQAVHVVRPERDHGARQSAGKISSISRRYARSCARRASTNAAGGVGGVRQHAVDDERRHREVETGQRVDHPATLQNRQAIRVDHQQERRAGGVEQTLAGDDELAAARLQDVVDPELGAVARMIRARVDQREVVALTRLASQMAEHRAEP